MSQQDAQSKTKRPYESPTVTKQANLKRITLFTQFGRDANVRVSDLPRLE